VYRIIIIPRLTLDSGVTSGHKLADAELHFQGPLSGLTLMGFAVWDNGDAGYRVSFPTRQYIGTSGQRRSFSLLRAVDQEDRARYEALQREIIDAYRACQHDHASHVNETAN
jgi:hypothetical protein